MINISAIIITYNYGKYLQDAIESVLAQTIRPNELLIVDDGSTDHTPEITHHYSKYIPWIKAIRIPNSGASIARNIGIENTSGKWVAFLDADDMWMPNRIEVQLQYHLQHMVDITYAYQIFKLEKNYVVPPQLIGLDFNIPQPSASMSGVFFLRDVYKNVGAYDPTFKVSEDSDWLHKAKSMGYRHHIIRDVLLIRRLHSHNLSSSISIAERKQIVEKLAKKYPLSFGK